MATDDLEFIETFSPSSAEIDFLTEKINEESRAQNICCDAYPFGIFLKRKNPEEEEGKQGDCFSSSKEAITSSLSSSPSHSPMPSQPPTHQTSEKKSGKIGKEETKLGGEIIGGCNGSVVYGSVYTDQLWVDQKYRGKGLGKVLMEKVHDMARRKQCSSATVSTMDFQGAQSFYEKLGYEVEFVRGGYFNGGKMIYLKKVL